MVSYKALNTVTESILTNASHGTWNIDGGQRTAAHESIPSNASHLTSSNTVSDFSRGSTFILKPFYSSSIG